MKVLVSVDIGGIINGCECYPVGPGVEDLINGAIRRGDQLLIVDGPVTVPGKLAVGEAEQLRHKRALIASEQMAAWLPAMIEYVDDHEPSTNNRDLIAARMAAELGAASADFLLSELEGGNHESLGSRPVRYEA